MLAEALRGVALLARGRGEGIARFEGGLRGAQLSLIAAPICLALYAATRAIEWRLLGVPARPWRAAVLEMLAFVIGWAGFAVASEVVLRRAGAAARWPLYIAAWGWCNIVGYGLVLLGDVPDLLGAPAIVSEAVGLIVFGWALWVEWFAAMLTLERDVVLASALVLMDMGFGVGLVVVVGLLS